MMCMYADLSHLGGAPLRQGYGAHPSLRLAVAVLRARAAAPLVAPCECKGRRVGMLGLDGMLFSNCARRAQQTGARKSQRFA